VAGHASRFVMGGSSAGGSPALQGGWPSMAVGMTVAGAALTCCADAACAGESKKVKGMREKLIKLLNKNELTAAQKLLLEMVEMDECKEDLGILALLAVLTHHVGEDASEHFRKVFDLFDQNKDGYMTGEEIKNVYTSLGTKFDDDKLSAFIKAADKNGDNKISFEEYLNVMTSKVE